VGGNGVGLKKASTKGFYGEAIFYDCFAVGQKKK
jgi:hypothetical protein